MPEATNYLLEMKNITKRFPGVLALDQINLNLKAGEVHVLLGENGAGKSTLIKILSGAYKKDEGEIYFNSEPIEIKSPKHAMELGVGVIYQEFNLNPFFSIAENIYLGNEFRTRTGLIDWKKTHSEAAKVLDKVGLKKSTKTKVKDLTVAEMQLLEIAKALSEESRIIVFDEPTATLAQEDVDRLFSLIEKLKKQGKAIIYISHRMEEIKKIGDRCTILRDGQYIDTVDAKTTERDELIRLIAGRKIDESIRKIPTDPREVVMEVEGLSAKEKVRDVSFNLRKGEILGVAGLVGSGRTEAMKTIVGCMEKTAGTVRLNGSEIRFKSPVDSLKKGVIYLSEDRKGEGLVLCMNVMQNITLTNLKSIIRGIAFSKKVEKKIAKEYIGKLRVKCSSERVQVKNLSGGNQQKVVISKALTSGARILIFDEPTRGIDVGAKDEIYDLMFDLAQQGYAIIMISSELAEVLKVSNRIMVMREGEVSTILENKELTQEKILHYAMGA
ncbi:MAG TPA: sugar ABC transporter ATP-binding protein [Thermotogota bacterium]|nr:sugar ABC transporter ATP-binding protein [Thermotogota bacterium]HPJ88290.1 sugar ABC transporter ATP-binding protein [Thermotogota bacterium]HPR95363.1 sugar ABC transporter ATP-binding protein [Thermotogota bacterium]